MNVLPGAGTALGIKRKKTKSVKDKPKIQTVNKHRLTLQLNTTD